MLKLSLRLVVAGALKMVAENKAVGDDVTIENLKD